MKMKTDIFFRTILFTFLILAGCRSTRTVVIKDESGNICTNAYVFFNEVNIVFFGENKSGGGYVNEDGEYKFKTTGLSYIDAFTPTKHAHDTVSNKETYQVVVVKKDRNLKTIQVRDSGGNICTNASVVFSEQSISPFVRAGVGTLNKDGNFTFETEMTIIDYVRVFAFTSNEFGVISMNFNTDFSTINMKKGSEGIIKKKD